MRSCDASQPLPPASPASLLLPPALASPFATLGQHYWAFSGEVCRALEGVASKFNERVANYLGSKKHHAVIAQGGNSGVCWAGDRHLTRAFPAARSFGVSRLGNLFLCRV